MDRSLQKVGYCFYVDDKGKEYFSVLDFMLAHNLPLELRDVVIDEMKAMDPDTLILEEEN